MFKLTTLIKVISIISMANILGCHVHSTDHSYDFNKSISDIKVLNERVDKKSPYRGTVKVIPLVDFNKFNANEYFKVFTHIKPPIGSVLDFVYYKNSEHPILYFRKYDEPLNITYTEFKSRYGDRYYGYSDAKLIADLLEVDGTKESFVELLLFLEYAGKFHQPNHNWCGTPHIMARIQREKMISKCVKHNEKVPSEDPVFGVDIIDANTVLVSKTVFSTDYFEYFRVIYQISKTIPHNIAKIKTERTSACVDFEYLNTP